MSELNEVKAGKYQLVALSWDHITSKPGEPLDFTRYRRGDVVELNVEDAKRLVAAGAVVAPGALERSALEHAKAVAEQAQRAYEAALAGMPEDVRAEVAPGTVPHVPDVDPAGSAGQGGQGGGDERPVSDKIEDVLRWVGDDQDRARMALDGERSTKGEKARERLTAALEKLLARQA
ncbi:hypothetical protein GCM10023340_38860 [Nocardioides marinquilinus]|uniref:Uncharacterized protein n=1 Tax=Nocardioides marinquilinus TaxID=1210400 RepID=A0ABP9PZR3_9ACTN